MMWGHRKWKIFFTVHVKDFIFAAFESLFDRSRGRPLKTAVYGVFNLA